MRIYHTVSSKPLDPQPKVGLSLGGYRSSTYLRNDSLGNMFGGVSMYTVKNSNQDQYLAFVLRNELGFDIENVKLWFEYDEDCYSNILVAAVNMSTDSDGNLYMEQVRDINEKPLYAEFFEANGEANAVDIGSLVGSETVGLWFRRSLLIDKIKEDQDKIYEKLPTDEYRYREVVLPKFDSIDIKISYDAVVV